MMSDETDTTDRAAAREQLSALIDGELGGDEIATACQHWRSDTEARASWHAYQLIGDALRSDDLCSAPGHDAAFLGALRSRLADEPVVLAPQAAVSVQRVAFGSAVASRRGWRVPVAVAAGFVAVVGVVIATRVTDPAPGTAADGSTLARSEGAPSVVARSAPAGTTVAAGGGSPAVDVRGLAASGQLIRDVRLDRYLSAHKQFAGSSALGVPSGFLRNATADAAER